MYVCNIYNEYTKFRIFLPIVIFLFIIYRKIARLATVSISHIIANNEHRSNIYIQNFSMHEVAEKKVYSSFGDFSYMYVWTSFHAEVIPISLKLLRIVNGDLPSVIRHCFDEHFGQI